MSVNSTLLRQHESLPSPNGATDERTLVYDSQGALTPWRDLFLQQAVLELEMRALGAERAQFRADGIVARRAETEAGYGQALVAGALTAVAKEIKGYISGIDHSAPGRKPAAAIKLRGVDPERAALWTLRVLADGASVETPLVRAALDTAELVEAEAQLGALRALDREAAQRLAEATRRQSRRRQRKAMLGRACQAAGLDWRGWSANEKQLVGVKLIDLALNVSSDFEAKCVRVGEERTEWRIVATARTRDEIARLAEMGATLRPVYAPMVAPPRPYEGALGGGYLTSGVRPLRLVKPQPGRPVERDDAMSIEDAPIVFAAANAAQATPWRVNGAVLTQLERALRGGGAESLLPAADAAPEPGAEVATEAEGPQLWRLRAEWAAAEKVRRARRMAVERAAAEGRRYSAFEQIYLPVQYDFRGRMYAVPAFNPQGPDFMRALFQFARGKPLGPEGWKWLAIHLCNQGDFEKMSKAPLGERAAWVLDNEERILSVAIDPESDLFWHEADNPWQFLAACFEWAGFRSEGESFVSHLPIALDGACSGLQHFSLALRDEAGGAAVNLSPREGRAADIYEEVASRVQTHLEKDASAAENDADEPERRRLLARQWLQFGVSRKLCKRPTMTYGYGARSYGYAEQVMSDVLEPAYEAYRVGAGAWPFDGRGFEAARYMATLLIEAIEDTVVKAAEAMRWLQDCASVAAAEGLGLVWRAPDGFIVRQEYRETQARRIRAALAGKPMRLTLQQPAETIDKRRQRQGVAPNFVHALDGCHLRLTVARAWEEGMRDFALIHDSFGVHASDTPRFFQLIRETMVEMYAEVDVMADFADALAERVSEARRSDISASPPPGALALEGVLLSEFCFS